MTRTVRFFACFLFIAVFELGAATHVPPDLKRIVTFIFSADAAGGVLYQNDEPSTRGTGFFVLVTDESDKSTHHIYLVTARHVLQDKSGLFIDRFWIRLDLKAGGVEFIPVSPQRDSTLIVCEHPSDRHVDIAVVPLIPSLDKYDYRYIMQNFLMTKESFSNSGMGEGTEVFFAGLFTPFYGTNKNYPIIRYRKVSMIPEERIEVPFTVGIKTEMKSLLLYLIETMAFGGNSGSPVFFYQGSDRRPGVVTAAQPVLTLAGVMSGAFTDESPLSFREAQREGAKKLIPLSKQNVGIAAVVPSYLLHEILFSEPLKKLRADYIAARSKGANP